MYFRVCQKCSVILRRQHTREGPEATRSRSLHNAEILSTAAAGKAETIGTFDSRRRPSAHRLTRENPWVASARADSASLLLLETAFYKW